jgi:hypothetical protein
VLDNYHDPMSVGTGSFAQYTANNSIASSSAITAVLFPWTVQTGAAAAGTHEARILRLQRQKLPVLAEKVFQFRDYVGLTRMRDVYCDRMVCLGSKDEISSDLDRMRQHAVCVSCCRIFPPFFLCLF